MIDQLTDTLKTILSFCTVQIFNHFPPSFLTFFNYKVYYFPVQLRNVIMIFHE